MNSRVSGLATLVEESWKESAGYLKQWNLWLCLGSAGAAVATITLAAKLPDPSYAFRFFLPSLWLFLLGTAAAAAGVLVLARYKICLAEHFASAHNRNESEKVIRATPYMMSSPQRLAHEANSKRDRLILENRNFHESAERAWVLSQRWLWAWRSTTALSASGFLLGVAWPLLRIGAGANVVPAG